MKGEKRLKDIWDSLPDLEHTNKYFDEKAGLRIYEICGKKFQETVKLSYVMDVLKKFQKEFGHRVKLARENNLCDWKSISHALRAAYQVKSILTSGDIIFPLTEAPYLIKVKNGELDFLTEVSPKLDELMLEVEELSQKSILPEKVNRNFWDDWLVSVIEDEYYGYCKEGR